MWACGTAGSREEGRREGGGAIRQAAMHSQMVDELQGCRGTGVQGCRGAEVQRCRGAGVQGCRGAEVQRCAEVRFTAVSPG